MSDAFQKIPPQNLEAEQALLGSMMMDVEVVKAASSSSPMTFTRPPIVPFSRRW